MRSAQFPHKLRMASIAKTAKGYRTQVYVRGLRESRCFRTKHEAVTWAAAQETLLRENANKTPGERYTLFDALRKYGDEISPQKRGVRWERIRLAAFEKTLPDKPLSDLGADDLAQWRDARLRVVSSGSVRREIALLADVLEVARREWRWIKDNPIRDVKRPASPAHRDVIFSNAQIRAILKAIGYQSSGPVKSISQAVGVCFLVALRTGMRAGELTGLKWGQVHAKFCELPVTKTKARDVPLPYKARRLIQRMRGFDSESVFGLMPQTLDALFRKYRNRAGIEGVTFHDARHTAATRIGREGKLELLEFCRMFGWSNPRQAMIYFNATAESIADRMDVKSRKGP